MNISIRNKIFAVLFSATLLIVIFMSCVIQWGFDRGFLEYVNIEEQEEIQQLARKLEEYYSRKLSWNELADNPLKVYTMHAEILPPGKSQRLLNNLGRKKHLDSEKKEPDDNQEKKHRYPIQRTVILDEAGKIIFGDKLYAKLPHMTPLLHNGARVGSIGLYLPQKLFESNQVTFIEKQTTFIIMAFLASMVIAIAFSMFLAFSLANPIRRLSSAAGKLNDGDYSVRVSVGYRDELGQLSQDINTLANTLKKNQEQRERWVSDIAHELRTPLTSLKGQIEALQDGIRTPDQRTYDRLQHGVNRLERLVNDLYDLNLSDVGAFAVVKNEVSINEILEMELIACRPAAEQAGLQLRVNSSPAELTVYGDSQRLQQMISNLLTNSVRYTNRGGEISVILRKEGTSAVLEIEDSAPGVPDTSLPRLFDRLYRVEESRNRALGGAGLGLAICREIVAAHGGTVAARHSSSGGLHVIVTIPLLDEES